jgi:hypothetical protein
VLFKNGYINKAISAGLLVLLLFIHSIKLLHTHGGQFSNPLCKSNHAGTHDYSVKANYSDCSICNYQLAKDSDDIVHLISTDAKPEQNTFSSAFISFHKSSFYSAFETRGPPVIA